MLRRMLSWICVVTLSLTTAVVGTEAAHAQPVPRALASTIGQVVELPCVDGVRARFTQTHAYGRQFGATARVTDCASGAAAVGRVQLRLADGADGAVLADQSLVNGFRALNGVSAPERESTADLVLTFVPAQGETSSSWPVSVTTAASSVTLRLVTDVQAGGTARASATVLVPRSVNLGQLMTPNQATGQVEFRKGDTVLARAELVPLTLASSPHESRTALTSLAGVLPGDTVTVVYLGDAGYPETSLSEELVDNRSRTEFSIASLEVNATHAQVVAHLDDLSNTTPDVLTGARVSVTVNGRVVERPTIQAYEVTSTRGPSGDERQRATIVVNFQLTPGTYVVGVDFAGSDRLRPTSVTGSISASKVPTSITRPAADITRLSSTGSTVLRSSPHDSAGKSIPGTVVTFQERPVGSTSWRAVGKATTDKHGNAALRVTPRTSRDYRAVVQGTSTYLTSTSATRRVTVERSTTLKRVKHSASPRTKAVLVTKVAPTGKVILQERRADGRWVTVTTRAKRGAAGTTSEVRITVSRGTKDRVFRVLVKADGAATQAISPRVTVPKR